MVPGMPSKPAVVVPVFASWLLAFLFAPEAHDAAVATFYNATEKAFTIVGLKKAAEVAEAIDMFAWWSPLSPEERVANMIRECEEREVGFRKELEEVAPDSWLARQAQAKLAASLLETNASQVQPLPERYEEGRALTEKLLEAAPDDWRARLAKVKLLLADFNDTRTEEASRLAEEVAQKDQNRFTNLVMGQAFLVDGCSLLCRTRKFQHRIDVDPPGSVYPEGKDPAKLMQSYVQTAYKRLVEAGKRLHTAIDAELYEKDPSIYGPKGAPYSCV